MTKRLQFLIKPKADETADQFKARLPKDSVQVVRYQDTPWIYVTP